MKLYFIAIESFTSNDPKKNFIILSFQVKNEEEKLFYFFYF